MRTTFCFLLACAFTASAQLTVTVSPPRVVGQKAVVQLVMTNRFDENIESARAVCFLFNGQGGMVGQSSKWVIGGSKNRPALEPKKMAVFDFVITASQSLVVTNLTAHVDFTRLILEGGKVASTTQDVIVTPATAAARH